MKKDADHNFELSIVIPVYRSAGILPLLVDAINHTLINHPDLSNFELILVNDASPDNSWQVICELAKRHHFIKGISLRRNFSQHNAIMAGLNYVNGKYIILMDDDMQHPPETITDIVKALSEDADVCYTKYLNRQHPAWKKLGSKFNNWFATSLLGKPKDLYLSSFKGLTYEVVQEIIRYDGPYAYIDGLILEVTNSITSINIEHQPRCEGKGNYNLRCSISLWLKMVTSFSILPLRLATISGFVLSAISLIMIIVVVVQRITHPDIPAGWTSIVAIMLLIGGIQTLCIGMIGEYLGRTYLKLNNKPQYIIGKTTGNIKSL